MSALENPSPDIRKYCLLPVERRLAPARLLQRDCVEIKVFVDFEVFAHLCGNNLAVFIFTIK